MGVVLDKDMKRLQRRLSNEYLTLRRVKRKVNEEKCFFYNYDRRNIYCYYTKTHQSFDMTKTEERLLYYKLMYKKRLTYNSYSYKLYDDISANSPKRYKKRDKKRLIETIDKMEEIRDEYNTNSKHKMIKVR